VGKQSVDVQAVRIVDARKVLEELLVEIYTWWPRNTELLAVCRLSQRRHAQYKMQVYRRTICWSRYTVLKDAYRHLRNKYNDVTTFALNALSDMRRGDDWDALNELEQLEERYDTDSDTDSD